VHVPTNKVHVDRKEVRAALFPTESGPIIRSRLQNDFYCYPMGAFASHFYRDVEVTMGFTNRTRSVRLAEEVREEDLRRELNHTMNLPYADDEVEYIEKVQNEGKPMFRNEYGSDLRDSKLPPYNLTVQDGQFRLTSKGRWHEVMDWEMPMLTTISALRTEALMKQKTRAGQDEVVEYTARAIEHKAEVLEQHPRVKCSDFGTRRAASPLLQRILVGTMAEHLNPGQFVGTSNVALARELSLKPSGTVGHLPEMVLGALANDDDELLQVRIKLLRQWWELFGHGLSIILPDAFGSNWMFKHLTEEFARDWKGMRQDSMDPYEFGEKQIKWYQRHGQDPRDHLLIPSDGLTLDSMLAITYHFIDRIDVSSGPGTMFTNDTSLGHLSMVVKAMLANGRPCVKLSDNLAKGLGLKSEQERYARVFDYDVLRNEACVV